MNQRRPSSHRRTSGVPYRKKPSGEWPRLLLFYVLPFVVFNSILFFAVTSRPKCELTIHDTTDYLTTEVTLEIKSWMPVKDISVSMDTIPFELIKEGRHTYKIIVQHNGVVEAEVVNFNGMTASLFEHVDILDDVPPSLEDADINEGIVSMTLSDGQSGIDYSSITAADSLGTPVEALSLSKDTGSITFEMPETGLVVSATDMAGNEVQGTFSVHREGEEDMLSQDISGDGADAEASADAAIPDTAGVSDVPVTAEGTETAAQTTETASDEPEIRIE